MSRRETLLGLRNVSVAYPGTLALDNVTLDVRAGDVLAVVGANGSGKTTLLSTLTGQRPPTSGTLTDGTGPITFPSQAEALARRVCLVPQEPQIAETLPVWENLTLANQRVFASAASRRAREDARQTLLKALPHIDPDAPGGSLRKADRAIVCLLRALSVQPRVLALDEPTAVLGDDGVEVVAGAARRVCEAGGAVVLVSHRLRDIVRLANRVAVLVDGRLVHDGPVDEGSIEQVIDVLAAGQQVTADGYSATAVAAAPVRCGEPVLRINGLRTADGLHVDDLSIGAGDILGVAGLAGSGRSRLCRLIAGLAGGHDAVTFLDRRLPHTARACRRAGIGYIPEDRVREALFTSLTVAQNIELTQVARKSLATPWSPGPNAQWVSRVISDYGVKTPSQRAEITALSGGNQQRVVLARALLNRPHLLVADEPTQGVDRTGRSAIHQMIKSFADSGGSVLVVSSEFEELQELATRMRVIRDGTLSGDLPEDIGYRELLVLATGADRDYTTVESVITDD